MTINIENEYTGNKNPEIDFSKIADKVIKEVLNYEKVEEECEVDILLTGDDEIKELNNEFRSLDKSTDVLSFPMGDMDPDTNELMLGDIVISIDHLVDQAEAYGHSKEREFGFLVAHSMLHLLGYDHMTEDEAADMEKRQREILENIGLTR